MLKHCFCLIEGLLRGGSRGVAFQLSCHTSATVLWT